MLRAATLAPALAGALAAPAMADPHPQLAASVQQRLDVLGFRHVDARTLSLSQLAALQLQLQGRAMAFGIHRFDTEQRVKAILRRN